jgi:class 3 adenylate cyclase
VLKVCFDRLAGAVVNHGGEVLKFIGDGTLAVSPYVKFDRPFSPEDRLGTPQALRP